LIFEPIFKIALHKKAPNSNSLRLEFGALEFDA